MPERTGESPVIPTIEYPAELPISDRRQDIAQALERHQVIVVAGETGSGKTTQLPKLCLELGRGRSGRIGHTQPRRLAARNVAARIADELKVPLATLVGYQVRFGDQCGEDTLIKLMTDGILLNELQRDRLLRQYDTLIIDEAHERSLNIDFLLGYLKRILPQRPDLKIIITSATIDLESFSQHFGNAPVIEVSGRAFPVTTHYFASRSEAETGTVIAEQIEAMLAGDFGAPGDALVFLPGERDIRETARVLRTVKGIEVLPLYARLSQAEQSRVFERSGRRNGLRVVLATNVAETSLTVPGIRFVIDTGSARISRYSHRTKLQRLPIEPVSRASADQRQGRCGRVGPGVCLRLYSEEDYLSRPAFTEPEIQRTNLASVILQMLHLRLGDVAEFPFIDPPDGRLVRDGYKLLEELGAVNADGRLTKNGRAMSRLPVDPRLGRMLLAASQMGCVAELLVIVSALSVQDPRERPADKQQQSAQAHARFRHPRSDFIAWLNLWRYYEERRQELSQNQLRKLCKREFLSFTRMREWRDVHRQLCIACRQQGIRTPVLSEVDPDYEGVHRALISGLLSHIAQWQEQREYLGARHRKLVVFPGSALAKKPPKWLVAAEIVETSRVFAREAGAIDPAWAVDVNPSLQKRQYHTPRWQARSGRAMAYERVTLLGLTLRDKRSVHYGPIAPTEARNLLIREGLIAGRMPRPPAFLEANRALAKEIEALEARTRRRDLLADEEVQFRFYDERLPAEMYTTGRLVGWLKQKPSLDASLRMPRELLLVRDPDTDWQAQFPGELQFADLSFTLDYCFEPGGVNDGVTVTVPVALLNRVPRYRFDWLVPGLLREKCIALVKSLPKEQRKRLVPAPDFVDKALSGLMPDNADLHDALARRLGELGRVRLAPADFKGARLDDYYRMNVRVVDADGRELAQSRDLAYLVDRFRTDARQQISSGGASSPARVGIKRWDFPEIKQRWELQQAGVDIVAYPALVDHTDSVAIELFDYPWQAQLQHRLGVLRLLYFEGVQQVRYLRKQLLAGNDWQLSLAAAGLNRQALLNDLVEAAFVHTFQLDAQPICTELEFRQRWQDGKSDLVGAAERLEGFMRTVVDCLGTVRRQMAIWPNGQWDDTRDDIQSQLDRLLTHGFQRDTPLNWLAQFPRYFKALCHRVERVAAQYGKDQKYTAMLKALEAPLLEAESNHPGLVQLSPAVATYRFMLEEFRVSLFAQNLGTRQAVSEKRLREQWRQVVHWLADQPL
ncbi:MAG: ATP-dependent RNA helicase HrpA [Pseudomonadota bacterium]